MGQGAQIYWQTANYDIWYTFRHDGCPPLTAKPHALDYHWPSEWANAK
jgi:hypothetical protein